VHFDNQQQKRVDQEEPLAPDDANTLITFNVRTGRMCRQRLTRRRVAVRTIPPEAILQDHEDWLTYGDPCRVELLPDLPKYQGINRQRRARFWYASRCSPGKVCLVVYPPDSAEESPLPLLLWDFQVEEAPGGERDSRTPEMPDWAEK